MRYCCGCLSGVSCRLFAYGPADTTASNQLHHLVPHLNQKTFWYWLTVLEKIVPVVVLVVLAAAAAASYVS